MFYFKILILIFSYIFCQLPNSYHIDNLDENSRDLINGWPSKSILDLAIDSHGNIFAGTSGGIAKIVDVDLSSNETIEESLYIVSDANLPSGGNPSMEVFELDNANSLIVVSGVIGTIEEPIGTGLAWSINNGESWQHIFQPQDSENDSKFTSEWIIPNCGEVTPCKANVIENREWCGQTFTHLAVTTSTKNVSYDVSADVINGYIYAASWGGMLRRFKYTDSNPIWEVIPLPMDEQDELKCSDGTGYSDSYYYSPIDPDRGQYNHKPFSVHIVKDDLDNQVQWIWVGTADGINKGRIQNGQIGIDWTHYKNIEESEQFLDDWVTGIYSQKLQDDTGNNFTRIWAVCWVDKSTPHNLRYTDNNGQDWHLKEGLRSDFGAVTYSLYSKNDSDDFSFNNRLYASTSKGLYSFTYGCNDPVAENYNNTEGNPCMYNFSIDDGCDLEEDYFYLKSIDNNQYELLYNSTIDIYNFSFYIEGANLLAEPDLEGFNISTNQQGTYLSANAITFQPISAGCGTLLTLELNDIQDIYLKNINVNSGCFNYYSFGTHGSECSKWHKMNIPEWIFNEIGIENELDASFKVYSSVITDELESLWIGSNQGLFIQDIVNNDFYFPSYTTSIITDQLSGLLVYPNPFNLDIHNIAKFKLRTPYNGNLEVYDFSMSKIFNTTCYNDGEYLTCQWNGMSNNGQKIANGIYFCKVTAGNKMIWEKLGVVQLK